MKSIRVLSGLAIGALLAAGIPAASAHVVGSTEPSPASTSSSLTPSEKALLRAAESITRQYVGKQKKVPGGVVVIESATAIYPGMDPAIRAAVKPPLPLVSGIWAPYYNPSDASAKAVSAFFRKIEQRFSVPIAREQRFFSPMPIGESLVTPRVKGVSDASPGTLVTGTLGSTGFRCSAGVYGRIGTSTVLLTAGHCLQAGTTKVSSYKDSEGDGYVTTAMAATPWNGS